ncbi:MAG: cupredoxin domain-containing protein [Ktedonobacteraceae bacterium]|nr:cupredoxin domain-containing protein [Ktedonobacteraceae bacterium]
MRMTRHNIVALISLLMVTLVLGACGGSTATSNNTVTPTSAATAAPTSAATTAVQATTPAQTFQIKMVEKNEEYMFQPATITIPKGAQVTWSNDSDSPHTVMSDTSAFGTTSPVQAKQTFSMVFNTAGTFAYHCSLHSYMKATIIVTP